MTFIGVTIIVAFEFALNVSTIEKYDILQFMIDARYSSIDIAGVVTTIVNFVKEKETV